MKQISDNDNYSVDGIINSISLGWNMDEQINWIKYAKYFIALAILSNTYLIIISQVYKSYYPDWLYGILFAVSIFGLAVSVLNIFWKAQQESIIRQVSFLFSGFMIIICVSALIFLLASFQADYDQKVSQHSEYAIHLQEWQKFIALFYSIIACIAIMLISYLHITYSLYLCQDQQHLMITLHFYNSMFLFSGIAVNHYADIQQFQLFLLLFLIITSCLSYGANLKKIKIGYFTVGVILLCYLILNQYQHFLNIRYSKSQRIEVLQDCPNHLRTLHRDFLKYHTECEKYLPSTSCPKEQMAFKWESDQQIQITKRNTELGCLNLSCCGIVADRSKVKLNLSTAIHQLVGFATLTIIMYMSQKPPLLHTDITIIDFIFGAIQMLLVVAIIFLFSKEIGQNVTKFDSANSDAHINVPQGCSLMKSFIELSCQFSQCDNLEVKLKSDYPFQYYRLSNSKVIYQEWSEEENVITFYGHFESIEQYINNNIYICTNSRFVNIDVSVQKSDKFFEGQHRNLEEATNDDMFKQLANIKFWRLELLLNISSNFTVTLLNQISNQKYLEVSNNNILPFIQEQSYLIVVKAEGYISYEQHIVMNADQKLAINLAKQSSAITIMLSGSEKSILGTAFATSLYKQYTTTLWMGSNQYMELQYLDPVTQVITINQVNYPILIFIIDPEENAFLRIYDSDFELYRSYASSGGKSQQVLCLQGSTIRPLKGYGSNLMPNSLLCQ